MDSLGLDQLGGVFLLRLHGEGDGTYGGGSGASSSWTSSGGSSSRRKRWKSWATAKGTPGAFWGVGMAGGGRRAAGSSRRDG